MNPSTIAVIEKTVALSGMLSGLLTRHGFEVRQANDLNPFLALCKSWRPDVVILGPSTIDSEGTLDFAKQLRWIVGSTPIVLVPSSSSEELAIAALRAGINEYIKHPFRPDELVGAVRRCLTQTPGEQSTAASSLHLAESSGMIGESSSIRDLRARLARLASSDSNILITGETGTGKELVAAMLHRSSRRCERPFLTINCAAIPDSLLESELFGYERGAFTGAESRKEGKLKAAEGGTIFLDEIGDMSGYGQAKILRMIEAKEIQRLGRDGGISVDIRIIAATNQDLEELVKQEKFRKDLFFRLNVARIHLPALRERKEDLLSLVDYYIRYFNARFGRNVQRLSDEALECLLMHDWPGNIRELKNLLEAIFVDLPSGDISTAQLPPYFSRRYAEIKLAPEDERERLLWALSATNWNKSKAADKLHWSRMTLYRKMARYNIFRAS
jgi:DNA-binding NtrC family response regulator